MKKPATLTLAAAAAALSPAAPATAQPAEAADLLVLPAGSAIELMVLLEVDSDRSQPGDPVKLRVNSPVVVGETVVIPVGAAAQGEVTGTKKSGGMLRRGNISVDITAITLGDQTVPLDTSLEQKARGGESDDFLKVTLAPMWILFARGSSARLKAGELLTAEIGASICFAAGEGGHRIVPCPPGTDVGDAAVGELAAD